MKHFILIIALFLSSLSFAQVDDRLTTIEFVEVVNNNKAEALFYFQNNWKVLRDKAIKKNYIHSYQLLETPASDDASFQIMLLTTYQNKTQYDQREEHFQELIKESGGLKLLNNKKPVEFRKSLFSKDMVRHWN
ncbi:hypothetical protein MWU58_13550 [Flavobacteriaceae bacterium S0825]|uniref:hypothetical protein n=1 Tax=Gaetbulibacter sp. S0825 TaxID=2720084 RepID=UPI001430ACFD|nr:hypothetical protein [Gaetbulibacter sp. S0825]MCK0110322.1 hypothetical protein [Flavobacteriaceae bacterium S0825]NIX65951.1 hypothetical protein [Gaetbulibacter sp. S0825]